MQQKQVTTNQRDAELITAIKECTDSGTVGILFSELATRHYHFLKSYVAGLMRNNPDEVSDVVHDTLIKVFENIHSFENKSSFTTWMFSIARNIVFNNIRDAQRKPPIHDVPYESFLENDNPTKVVDDPEYEEVHDAVTSAFTDYDSPELIYEGTETLELIHAAINDLHPSLQEIYHMRFIEQMSYEEIGAELGLAVGTVSGNIHKINKIIKEIVDG